jgi:glycosyltransferase involved in cell wall biosynthesis
MPTVSVIIPAYNRADYIQETVNSVLSQTYTDYEIIVINDGSTDQTEEALRPFIENGSIRYIWQENQGEAASRNHAMRLAQGRYYAFLDSDDLFLPAKLEKQVAFLDAHPEVGLVHSSFIKFSEDGPDLGFRDMSPLTGNIYPKILMDWSRLIVPSTVMVRASVIADVGDFDLNVGWGPDQEMWRRISRKYPIGVIPEALSKYRVHPGNISANKVPAAGFLAQNLQKAFDEDPSLGLIFQRRALAKMYANVAHNVLSAGNPAQKSYVRQFSIKAIRYWPFQWSAYLGFLGSFLGEGLRVHLLEIWRAARYPDKRVSGG